MLWIVSFLLMTSISFAQKESQLNEADVTKIWEGFLSDKWYEKLSLRGYTQIRYNRLFETNSKMQCRQCDKSIGENNGFFIRRGRLILFGEINPRVFVYIQPDFASDADGGNNYFQMRDAYFDYAITADKDFRIRMGISKVPWGFENLQSSSNRPTLDRNDALNSAVPNERDTGVYLMYTPENVRKIYQKLTNAQFKGSGDYGLFAIGAHNGQTLNKPEKNNDLHRVMRLTYPFEVFKDQFLEASIQTYEGKFNLDDKDYYDQRNAVSLVYYPNPWGFQTEYNWGSGPEYDVGQNKIRIQSLAGGYAQLSRTIFINNERLYPYIKYQYYEGAKKVEDATAYTVREWEIGSEWQPHANFELTMAYAISDRFMSNEANHSNNQQGQWLRIQAQINY